MPELRNTFRPEFLNRVDDIIVFQRLTKENIKEIASRLLAVLQKRVEDMGIEVTFSDEAVSKIADAGFDDVYGARPLKRAKKHCRTQNDVQGYLFMYQGFSNDLMMLMGNLMQWKFRMPSIFKGALRSMTEKTVHDVCTKTVWKKDDVHKTAAAVRQYKERLGYSEQWMTEYVYNVVMLAKKEPKQKANEEK